MTVNTEPNRISEQDKTQLNTYQQLEQEYFCGTRARVTLIRFRRHLPVLNHGHP